MTKTEQLKSLLSYLKEEGQNSEIFNYGFGQLSDLLKASSTRTGSSLELQVVDAIESKYGQSGADGFYSSLLTSYYTSNSIVESIIASLPIENDKPLRVLDPAAGTGNLLSSFSNRKNIDVVAIEKDRVAYDYLQSKYPQYDNTLAPFEEVNDLEQFDLVIGNYPFGDYKVSDQLYRKSKDPVKQKSLNTVHNYFALKSFELTKDKGLSVFIVTSAFSDSKRNENLRSHLVENGNLKAFYRLPTNIFKEAGTKVSTDLIVIEKDLSKRPDQIKSYEKQFCSIHQSKGISVNLLLAKQVQLGLGQITIGGLYKKDRVVFETDKTIEETAAILNERLSKALQSFQFSPGTQQVDKGGLPQDHSETSLSKIIVQLPDYSPSNSLHLHNNALGQINHQTPKQEQTGDKTDFTFTPISSASKLAQFAKSNPDKIASYFSLKQSANNYFFLLNQQKSGNPATNLNAIENARNILEEQYNVFTFRFGFLSEPSSNLLLEREPNSAQLKSLEYFDPKSNQYSKSDILTDPSFHLDKQTVKAENFDDSMILSINKKGRIDIPYMAQLLSKSQDSIIQEGLTSEKIFYNITNIDLDTDGTTRLGYDLEPRDLFLSGRVIDKITNHEQLTESQAQALPYYNRDNHVDLLKAVEPIKLPLENLDIQIGERWIDKNIYSEFATQLFQTTTSVNYLASSDKFSIKVKGFSSINSKDLSSPKSRGTYTGADLLEYALLNVTPSITKTIIIKGEDIGSESKEKKVPDYEKIKLFEMKVKKIRKSWESFILSRDTIKTQLENQYHYLFNNQVNRKYDGSLLNFDDVQEYNLRSTQKDGVYKFTTELGGIGAHKVGAGKTLIMVVNAMRAKRLGLVKKPMIIGLKANTEAIVQDFHKAYPEAKVLAPNEQDFAPDKRKDILHKIQTNNWDCVILTHDQFAKIPQDPHFQMKVLNEQIHAINNDLFSFKNSSDVSKKELKGLEKRKINLEVKVKDILASIDKDDVTNFKDMGIDFLQVDEAHAYKNLMFTTRSTNVSGLGNPQGSNRALNLLIATRTIQAHHGADKGVALFTATPLSNSIVEMYTWFNYLNPTMLKERNIHSFDAWASMYAIKSTDFEFSVTGEIKAKERFREFVKIPELVKDYHKIAHVVGKKDLDIQEPEINNILVNIDPTQEQVDFNDNLIEFAKSQGRDGHLIGKNFTDNQQLAFMLIVTNESRKMSTDMRLIDPTIEYTDQSKIGEAASNINHYYREFNQQKGTQFVFCDLGTPGSKAAKLNIYEDLAAKLVSKGIPRTEIAFIHDCKNRNQKKEMIAQFNAGDIRIMIGSTEKMGVGINGQEKVCAMHHLNINWRPIDFEQKNGRGARPGNLLAPAFNGNKVDNFIYATNRTLDAYMFQNNLTKQNFIDQINSSNINIRRIDEGSMSDDGSLNFAEYVAITSGNSELLEKQKLEKQLSELKNEKDLFFNEHNKAKAFLLRSDEQLTKSVHSLHLLEQQYADYLTFYPVEQKNELTDKRVFSLPVEIKDKKLTRLADVIDNWQQAVESAKKDDLIARFGKFKVFFNRTETQELGKIGGTNQFNRSIALHVEHDNGQFHRVTYHDIVLEENLKQKINTPFTQITTTLNRLEFTIQSQKDKIEDIKDDVLAKKRIASEEYKDQQKIDQLEDKISNILDTISMDNSPKDPTNDNKNLAQNQKTNFQSIGKR